ncbi:ATP-binding protein [Spirosoma sp. SC4-14]|uniref:hybrid sensor histidine kinase/response regulator transcription factor n=1 Tax=Spirosoma sp. SC4-14 TaxID=3128900 RepID=UPI0030D55524
MRPLNLINYWWKALSALLIVSIFLRSVHGQTLALPQAEAITYRQGLPQAFVPSIIQDRQGFIWMATRDGLCRYDGTNFKVFQPTADGRPGITSSSLFGLSLDPQGRIWIFSDQNDIDIIDPVQERFTNISRQPFFASQYSRDIIDAHYIDRQGRLWLSFLSDKILCFDPISKRLRQYKRQPTPGYFPTFSAFLQDQQGTLWMSNKTGLYRLDVHTDQFVKYNLPKNDVRAIHFRSSNELLLLLPQSILLLNPQTGQMHTIKLSVHTNIDAVWHHSCIVSDSKGTNYFNVYNQLFRLNQNNTVDLLDELDNQTAYRGLLIDRSDVLWGGTSRAGVVKYNLRTNRFSANPYRKDFYHDLLIDNLGLPASQIKNIAKDLLAYNFRYTYDQSGKLWFNMGNNRLYQADLQTKSLNEIAFPVSVALQHAWTDPVICLDTDPSNRIWLLTDSLAMWYQKDQWHSFRHPIRSSGSRGQKGIEGKILQMVTDRQALWVATSTHGLFRVDQASGEIKQFKNQPNNPESLSSNQLFCVFTDPIDNTILWVGTFGNGLCRFDKRTGLCRRFTTKDGLPNNVIYAAIPDKQGFLWIATNQGVCRMSRKTYKTRTYTHEDGLLEDEFNRFHFIHLPNDRIILGGLGGITSFYPNQLRDDNYQPAVQITTIKINNQPLLAGPLTDSLPVHALSQLKLPYDQNFLTIGFAALQYNNQPSIRYRYQLEGLNEQWVETNRPIAEYTDLRWGTYTLRLNGSNTSGIWSKHIRTLTLIIRPPWWATWWAILFYVVAGIGLIYGLVRTYLTQQESKQLKEIDSIKARFFTNITHDFRTPLTLILAPAEKLKQRLTNPDDQHQVDLITKNANQLLGLINQLMELAKAEAHVLRINESKGDLVDFLTQLVHSFDSQASTKGIQLVFTAENIHTEYWFDADKLERIVANLLANAIKFTPLGGKVSIEVKAINSLLFSSIDNKRATSTSRIKLTVSDNGLGVPIEQLPHIFDRFYQVDTSSAGQAEGSGIGLALVKELVEIQSGTIEVTSKVSIGTTFTLMLPYRSADSEEPIELIDNTQAEDQQPIIPEDIPSDEAPVILLVEDNEALNKFIADSLPAHYQIHQCRNGAEGLEQALALIPDLVISDVLMPIMDGYTLCSNLKNDVRTSHIPVILLTAKASVDSRIEGLSMGADDYITKPFNVQELQLRVRNLLDHQRQLREWAQKNTTNPEPVSDTPAQADPLLDKLYQLIELHLDEAAFGTEELIQESGLSRMNLHRKLKALTGTSTGEFIRNYRLKRAAQLLRQGHTVSETAYMVGFEDPSYFARSFRKVYQMTPSAFSSSSK